MKIEGFSQTNFPIVAAQKSTLVDKISELFKKLAKIIAAPFKAIANCFKHKKVTPIANPAAPPAVPPVVPVVRIYVPAVPEAREYQIPAAALARLHALPEEDLTVADGRLADINGLADCARDINNDPNFPVAPYQRILDEGSKIIDPNALRCILKANILDMRNPQISKKRKENAIQALRQGAYGCERGRFNGATTARAHLLGEYDPERILLKFVQKAKEEVVFEEFPGKFEQFRAQFGQEFGLGLPQAQPNDNQPLDKALFVDHFNSERMVGRVNQLINETMLLNHPNQDSAASDSLQTFLREIDPGADIFDEYYDMEGIQVKMKAQGVIFLLSHFGFINKNQQ